MARRTSVFLRIKTQAAPRIPRRRRGRRSRDRRCRQGPARIRSNLRGRRSGRLGSPKRARSFCPPTAMTSWVLTAAGGRYIVVCFFGSAASPRGKVMRWTRAGFMGCSGRLFIRSARPAVLSGSAPNPADEDHEARVCNMMNRVCAFLWDFVPQGQRNLYGAPIGYGGSVGRAGPHPAGDRDRPVRRMTSECRRPAPWLGLAPASRCPRTRRRMALRRRLGAKMMQARRCSICQTCSELVLLRHPGSDARCYDDSATVGQAVGQALLCCDVDGKRPSTSVDPRAQAAATGLLHRLTDPQAIAAARETDRRVNARLDHSSGPRSDEGLSVGRHKVTRLDADGLVAGHLQLALLRRRFARQGFLRRSPSSRQHHPRHGRIAGFAVSINLELSDFETLAAISALPREYGQRASAAGGRARCSHASLLHADRCFGSSRGSRPATTRMRLGLPFLAQTTNPAASTRRRCARRNNVLSSWRT